MVLLRNLRDSLAASRSSRAEFKLAETLLKAIRDHAVAGHTADRDRFQAQIAELNRRMVSTDDDPELLMIAGAAQQALRLYETETNAYWAAQTGELQGIVGSMTAALADFGARHSQAAGRLVQLERSLESISQVEDLRSARHQIEECLTALRMEIEHQSQTQLMFTECLAPRPASVTDPVTGLASRRAAEVAIADCLSRNAEGTNVALFVIHRIQQVNSRYGHAVGDQMLKTFLQHIGSSLRPADRLFRWSGPAILALVERDDPLDAVVFEMRRIAGFKLDQELEIRDRSVMVPLSASVCLVALTKSADLATMAAELDQFAASHLQR